MFFRRALAVAWLGLSVAASVYYYRLLGRTVDDVVPQGLFAWIAAAWHGGRAVLRATALLVLLWGWFIPIALWSIRRWD